MVSTQTAVSDFETLCIIEFSLDVLPDAIEWFMRKVKAPKPDGGGGLDTVTYINVEKHNVLHVGASHERLLDAAESLHLRKLCIDGTMRQFTRTAKHLFENCSNEKTFFTKAEKQRIVMHELDHMCASAGEVYLPSYPTIHLRVGKSVVRRCLSKGIIKQIFSLHDKEQIASFGCNWYNAGSLLTKQPMEKIRNYFGETIGMYFAFLEFYTRSLFIPAVVGILYWLVSWEHSARMQILFAVFNMVWATVFLIVWKRRSSELAYKWGTTSLKVTEQPRVNFHGETVISQVTGKPTVQYPKWKRSLRVYGLSMPVVIVCLLLAYVAMYVSLLVDDACIAWYDGLAAEDGRARWWHSLLASLPGIIYSVLIVIANKAYKALAVKLTEWENHRLQTTFENHLVLKLVPFWFVNTFLVMFYLTFYYQDLARLRMNLVTQLIVSQVIDQLLETLVPYLVYKGRKESLKKAGDIHAEYLTADGLCLAAKAQAELEATKYPYESTFDDYLELFIQFGFVTLFSCVYLLAGALALLNNVIEIRTDAVKLCKVHQRPFAQPACNIGVWQVVFEAMAILALITNCALIGMSTYLATLWPESGDVKLVLVIVIAEHILLCLQLLVCYVVPNVSPAVAVALARDEYQSKMAALELMTHTLSKKVQ